MNLIECMQTTSTCYKGTTTMTVKGILWHSTGANNPWIARYVQPSDNDPKRAELLKIIGKNSNGNDWNHKYVDAGLNAWIGKIDNGTVATVQAMPWNYRPWGCGSGRNGSCNSGWIQFEICEDDLNNKDYALKVYKEACELTAYLCKKYNLDPKGYSTINGIRVPVIICHWDSYGYGLGSGHGDVYHWFPKFGKCLNKSMDSVRNDVAELMGKVDPTPTPTNEMYRVRKTWEDSKSQIGAFRSKDAAIKMADERANDGYNVFDSKGMIVYAPKHPTPTSEYTREDFVREVQSIFGVAVDGIAGTQTLSATITVSRYINATNPVVKPIQKRLNALGFNCGEVDGIAGQKFENAVKAFQLSFGGVSDGEITKALATWKKLFSV